MQIRKIFLQNLFQSIVQQRLNNCFQQIPVGVSVRMSKVLLHKKMDSFHQLNTIKQTPICFLGMPWHLVLYFLDQVYFKGHSLCLRSKGAFFALVRKKVRLYFTISFLDNAILNMMSTFFTCLIEDKLVAVKSNRQVFEVENGILLTKLF